MSGAPADSDIPESSRNICRHVTDKEFFMGRRSKELVFFDLFKELSEKIIDAGGAFYDLIRDYSDVENKVARMKEMETECDIQTHKILRELNGSFITPFDREDIYKIAKEMDEIVDCLEEVSNRFVVFGVTSMKPEAIELTGLIIEAIKELDVLFANFHRFKADKVVIEQVIEVNRLENEGDIVYREGLKTLFKDEKDPIELIKWKHLFEQLEASLDACEDVANIVEGVVMKYA